MMSPVQFDADWLRPGWPAASGGEAVMTTRSGGISTAPFDSLNLGASNGDALANVQANRQRLADALGAAAGMPVTPVWLRQVHGTRVLRVDAAMAAHAGALPEADAAVTAAHGVACTVLVADCLPVLFAAPGGVGAAHAGWRGLAAGVVEATLDALCDTAGCRPGDVHAWLGACIGPRRFEVGHDVLQAFGADAAGSADADAFVRNPAAPRDAAPKWHADLGLLARHRLQRAGVVSIGGAPFCTVESASRFFSYRRDGVTGRMAAAVWRRGRGVEVD